MKNLDIKLYKHAVAMVRKANSEGNLTRKQLKKLLDKYNSDRIQDLSSDTILKKFNFDLMTLITKNKKK